MVNMEEQQPQSQSMQSVASLNKAINDFNALKIRLDTQEQLDKLEYYLRGARYEIVQNLETGKLETNKIQMGTPLASEEGIQQIMSWVSLLINPQTVQGNFPADKQGFSHSYEQQIYSFRVDFCNDLVLNIYDWDVDEEKVEGIVDRVCHVVEIFLSRCIDNEERKSYGQTMKSIETNVMKARGAVPMFKS